MRKLVVAMGVSPLLIGLVLGANAYAAEDAGVEQSILSLRAARSTVTPGKLVSVDVVVRNIADLRTYQFQLAAAGGQRGKLTLENITIDKDRPDFVFGADTVIDAVDMTASRAGALRFDGGTRVEKEAYVATFHFRPTADAKGTFRIQLKEGEDSFLADSANTKIAHGTVNEVEVTVTNAKTTVRTLDVQRGK